MKFGVIWGEPDKNIFQSKEKKWRQNIQMGDEYRAELTKLFKGISTPDVILAFPSGPTESWQDQALRPGPLKCEAEKLECQPNLLKADVVDSLPDGWV